MSGCLFGCRQNDELQLVSAAMREEKLQLQQEAEDLAHQLQAVLNDKFARRGTFDAETPIDKTLGYLQSVISVSAPLLQSVVTPSCASSNPWAARLQIHRGACGLTPLHPSILTFAPCHAPLPTPSPMCNTIVCAVHVDVC